MDETAFLVRSGSGGAGMVSFRREKFVPRGGPDGGNGGRGGSVVVAADPQLSTLLDLKYRKQYVAKNGRPGGSKDCTGADAADLILRVPVGTQVFDDETGVLIVDLVEAGARFELCRGGIGGRGNAAFATPSIRTPEYAQPGRPGEEKHVRLELKLLADVGLVGFPNAGKSTLISRLSRAKPKIADYPFTTLQPQLGVVRIDDERSFVIADMPGLIEGAADGAGLGHRFLKHIERTALFVFVITQDLHPDRTPVADYRILRTELEKYDAQLGHRPFIVALSQCDRPDVLEMLDQVRTDLGDEIEVIAISSVSGLGLDNLRRTISRLLLESGKWSAD
ncbi:MAG: GTPase ObgE [Myxococcota bacterium]|nr:GTPase ObgE [Myxococcota bacterium]